MLTGDLVRVQVKGAELHPSFIDPEKPSLRERAEELVALFEQAKEEQWTRGQLDETLADLVGDQKDHKLIKGLAKVLTDRCEFSTSSTINPAELRQQVFRKARTMGPLALEPGPLNRPIASDVIRAVAVELDVPEDSILQGLYADLQESQTLISANLPEPIALLHRYNVALVQACLFDAVEIKIRLEQAEPRRLRQLFRFVKFHQLLHQFQRTDRAIEMILDGPLSLFGPTTKYGIQLASFFPSLLLQPPPWRFEATILWTRARHRKSLVITPEQGLVTSLEDRGTWEPRELTWFKERFLALDTPWRLIETTEPIDLGGKALILPDLGLTDGTRVVWLEFVGWWRKDWLERRIELLGKYGPGNLILAVSRKLCGSKEKLGEFSGEVIEFAEILPPKAVLAAAERIAR